MVIRNLIVAVVILVTLSLPLYSSSQTPLSDSGLTKEVNAILTSDSSLTGTGIRVSVIQGVVKLSGQLDSEDQVIQATELIQSQPGVKDVDVTELRVKGSQKSLQDAVITAKIKGLLVQNKVFGDQDLDDLDITIETHNGVVTISGTAESSLEINNAIAVASSVSGVLAVKINLKISALRYNTDKLA